MAAFGSAPGKRSNCHFEKFGSFALPLTSTVPVTVAPLFMLVIPLATGAGVAVTVGVVVTVVVTGAAEVVTVVVVATVVVIAAVVVTRREAGIEVATIALATGLAMVTFVMYSE